jgi:hypothetical protein
MKIWKSITRWIRAFPHIVLAQMRKDPIFSTIMLDVVVKRIVKAVIAILSLLFITEKVIIPVYDKMVSNKKEAEREVNDNNLPFYYSEVSSEDYWNYVTVQKDLSTYLYEYGEFLRLDTVPVGKISEPENMNLDIVGQYFQLGNKLVDLKDKILREMLPTVLKYDRYDLEVRLDTLCANYKVWEKKLDDVKREMESFSEEKDLLNRAILMKGILEDDINNGIGYEDKTAYEKRERRLLARDLQEYIGFALSIHDLFTSDEYYKMESDFFELIAEYERMVKTNLEQKRWRTMTTLDFK